MNISFQISQEIPEFFRILKKPQLTAEHKVPSFELFVNEYIKKECTLEVFEKYKGIIEHMIICRGTLGLDILPIPIDSINNTNVILIKDKLCACQKVLFGDNHSSSKFNFEVLERDVEGWSYGHYLNILDNHLYNSNTGYKITSSANTYSELTNSIIKYFDLQPFIDWYKNSNLFGKYMELVDSQNSQIELELYNEWFNHQVNLLKEIGASGIKQIL